MPLSLPLFPLLRSGSLFLAGQAAGDGAGAPERRHHQAPRHRHRLAGVVIVMDVKWQGTLHVALAASQGSLQVDVNIVQWRSGRVSAVPIAFPHSLLS